jgi:hypothetical protein
MIFLRDEPIFQAGSVDACLSFSMYHLYRMCKASYMRKEKLDLNTWTYGCHNDDKFRC